MAGLVCLPTAALLVSAALALLVTKLRQAVNHRLRDPAAAQAETDRPIAVGQNRAGMRDDAPLSSVLAGRLHVAAQVRDGPSRPRKNVSTPR